MKMKKQTYNIPAFFCQIIAFVPCHALITAVFTLVLALLPAFRTLAMAAFIDTATLIFQGEKAYGEVILPLLFIMVSLIYENVMPVIRTLVAISGQNRLRVVLKSEILRKQASLEYRYLEDKESCDKIERVCNRIEIHFWEEYQNLLEGVDLVVRIVSLLAIVMRYTLTGGLLILAVAVPMFYLAFRLGKENYNMEKDSAALRRCYEYLNEVLTSREYAEERKLFSYSPFVKERYADIFGGAYKIDARIQRKRYFNMKSGSMFTVLIGVVILAVLLPAMENGRMSSGVYIALVTAIFGLVQGMSWQLSGAMYGLAHLKEYLKELGEFLQMDEKSEACSGPIQEEEFCFQSLEFRNVSFRYPGAEHDILKNCSFRLEQGKTYAFVGQNGAGKTTITKLLTGLYGDYEGEIRVNDVDIRKYPYSQVKGMIAVAFQDFARYALPVDENVRLGNLAEDSMENVQNVLQAVGLGEEVCCMKEGIHTKLGRLEEEGTDLSGGQWQRLEIARLLYADRLVNILDEPTAALDPMAEAQIYELFQRVNRDRFVIYITHRLGAARIADEILVLQDGHIVEQGSHETLVAMEQGIYQEMYESQRSWYEATHQEGDRRG